MRFWRVSGLPVGCFDVCLSQISAKLLIFCGNGNKNKTLSVFTFLIKMLFKSPFFASAVLLLVAFHMSAANKFPVNNSGSPCSLCYNACLSVNTGDFSVDFVIYFAFFKPSRSLSVMWMAVTWTNVLVYAARLQWKPAYCVEFAEEPFHFGNELRDMAVPKCFSPISAKWQIVQSP